MIQEISFDEPLVITAKRPEIKASFWAGANINIVLGAMAIVFIVGLAKKGK